jgi:hypothetical protein
MWQAQPASAAMCSGVLRPLLEQFAAHLMAISKHTGLNTPHAAPPGAAAALLLALSAVCMWSDLYTMRASERLCSASTTAAPQVSCHTFGLRGPAGVTPASLPLADPLLLPALLLLLSVRSSPVSAEPGRLELLLKSLGY